MHGCVPLLRSGLTSSQSIRSNPVFAVRWGVGGEGSVSQILVRDLSCLLIRAVLINRIMLVLMIEDSMSFSFFKGLSSLILSLLFFPRHHLLREGRLPRLPPS